MKGDQPLLLVFIVDTIAEQVAQLCQGHQVPLFLIKYLVYHAFLVQSKNKDTVRFEQWLCAISYARKNFNEQLVRAAINKSCVEDVADAICCLPARATLDDIIEKFKWLYGSVESFDTLMQEFYPIVQGKGKRVQTFVFHLEWALKVIKQQHPHAMTEEEGIKHLKDHLFHRLKSNIHNALCYMYDKPDS